MNAVTIGDWEIKLCPTTSGSVGVITTQKSAGKECASAKLFNHHQFIGKTIHEEKIKSELQRFFNGERKFRNYFIFVLIEARTC